MVILLSLAALAADATTPHPHQGVVKPYSVPPRPSTLTSAEQAQIRAGTPVYKQKEEGDGGRGTAIFVVDAPPEKVMATIASFGRYPTWIDEVDACEIYKKESGHVFVRFVLDIPGPVDVEYFIDHTWGKNWVTWTLDYSRESDLHDSVGMWYVQPLPEDPLRSQVEYSVDLRISGWVPDVVREILVDRGLQDATVWLKREAEK
jgi:hypothetical protein